MTTRLLAAAILIASAALAWVSISVPLAGRLLQAGIGVSIAYVAWLAWRGNHAIRAALVEGAAAATGDATGLPRVSLVVPARDEAAVIARIAADLGAQAYAAGGRPCFDVLIVDHASSDGTGEVARDAASRAGEHVRVVRREPGDGAATKGAALSHAMAHLGGEVIGVVDADARAAPDFLGRAMRAWRRDPGAAALQARRRPSAAVGGWLVAAQAEEQLMDLASQCGRWATDGTAELRGNGMFVRRDALERAGGWSATALTEDLELSTRLSAAGEHVTLAPEAVLDEGAVTTLASLWRQRMRWAEGSLRRLMDHGPALLGGRLPLGRKLDFAAFTGEFLVPPLFAAAVVASLVSIPLPQPADWTVPLSLFVGYGLGSFLLAIAGLAATGRRGLDLVASATLGALFLSHWLLVVTAALLRIALIPTQSAFVRTPRAAMDR